MRATLFRFFLRMYPGTYRRRFGDDMTEVFATRHAEVSAHGGRVGVAKLWVRTFVDMARAALAERLESRPAGLPARTDPRSYSLLPRRDGRSMHRLLQDFRFGLRTLSRSPGFTLVAVLTLGLGIGVTTSVFSLVNALLLRPLPGVAEPERLAVMFTAEDRSSLGVNSYVDYRDFAERADAFAGLAAFKPLLMDFSDGNDTERLQGQIVSGNYFDVLGVHPAAGRFFRPEDDDEPGAETVAVLGHALWREKFAGDPSIVGETVRLNGLTFDVIGVAPAGFRGTVLEARPQIFTPFMMQPHFMPSSGNLLDRRGWGGIFTVARLGEGVSIEQARDNLASVAAWIHETYPETVSWNRQYALVPFSEGSLMPGDRGTVVQVSRMLAAVMALVLAVACVNIANLMMTRAAQRRAEIAVRQALGADRGRLLRQLLVESLTLSLIGGLAGLLFVGWSQGFMRALPLPLELDLGLDVRVLAFALLASLATGLVFGLMPAVKGSRVDVAARMRRDGKVSGRRLTADALVVAQVALSLILLIGAGLFARTLAGLGSVDLGFDSDNVLVAVVDPGLQGYEGGEVKSFYDRLMPRIEAIPAVERASLVSALPGPENDDYWSFAIEGYTPADGERVGGYVNYVATGYFETMGIRLLRGRAFEPADAFGAPVVMVNETAAQRLAERTGGDALSARLGFEGPDGDFVPVVGVVADSKVAGPRAAARAQIYVNHDQVSALGMGATMALLVRTGDADPLSVAPEVRQALIETDPNVPVFGLDTLESHLSDALVAERLSARLLGFSAGLALLLASVGLYGVLSYSVTRRRREVGIRIALGARAGAVRGMVVRRGLVLASLGAVLGVAASMAVASALTGLLFGVSGTDPVTYGTVVGLMAIVAMIASYVPARRATRVDPLIALRAE